MLSRLNTLYTAVIFIALAAFEHMIIGLFPPLFPYISKTLHVPVSNLGFVSATTILLTAVSSVLWGYLSGKHSRKKLILLGNMIWVLSIFLTSLSQNYVQLLLFQMMTGVGLGCANSIGFSLLTDSIPYQKRGLMLSLWGMAQGLGGVSGSVMASLIANQTNWRWPFEIVGYIGMFMAFFVLFIKEPHRGGTEPELVRFMEKNRSYSYKIELNQLKALLLKRSNIYLYLQAFFINISTGSLIWLPTLYIYKIMYQGYSMKTAVIASGYLYALFQIGGMTSAVFGHLGDYFQKNTNRGRAVFTGLVIFCTVPLYIGFFALPMRHFLIQSHTTAGILIDLARQIILNPWISLLFILSFFASAAQSANTPNWLALITDVNLPEHRGTAYSAANLFNSFGRTIGNIGVGIILGIVSTHFKEPYRYILTLSILQFFTIPSVICYFMMARHNRFDILSLKRTLRRRSRS